MNIFQSLHNANDLTYSSISELQFPIAAFIKFLILIKVSTCVVCVVVLSTYIGVAPVAHDQAEDTAPLLITNPLSISIPRPNNAMTSSSSLTILPHICPQSSISLVQYYQTEFLKIIKTKHAKQRESCCSSFF